MAHGIESYLSISHVCTCRSSHRALWPGFQADVIVGIDAQKVKRRWRTDIAPDTKRRKMWDQLVPSELESTCAP